MQSTPIIIVIAAVIFSLATPARAIINGEPPAEDDKRFDAVGAFSRADWILPPPEPRDPKAKKPPARHNWFGCATLVAPDMIITSKHLLPKGRMPKVGEFAVRFRRHEDGTVGSRKEGEESYFHARVVGWRIARDADLAIGQLEKPVEHIQPIPISIENETLNGRAGFVAGWGSESKFLMIANPRRQLLVGPNRFHHPAGAAHVSIDPFPSEVRQREKKNEKTGRPMTGRWVTGDQAVPNMHDSGGAYLIEDETGGLSIVGVISSIRSAAWIARHKDDKRFELPLWTPEATDATELEPSSKPEMEPDGDETLGQADSSRGSQCSDYRGQKP